MIRNRELSKTIFALLLLGLLHPVWAGTVPVPVAPLLDSSANPKIALIIDDLGNEGAAGQRTVRLDGPVACAILPHSPFARVIAREAEASGKEVLLHLPLQPVESIQPVVTGSIGINNTRSELQRILEANLNSMPFVVGINNHMGSLLTQHPGHMDWLMEELKSKGDLFFVDSYTTSSSVAMEIALENGVPAARRDVFLDNEAEQSKIADAFEQLKLLARRHGSAIGIGHPYRETLTYLEYALPRLEEDGFELVPVAILLRSPATGQ